jgi:hypothetical protein
MLVNAILHINALDTATEPLNHIRAMPGRNQILRKKMERVKTYVIIKL